MKCDGWVVLLYWTLGVFFVFGVGTRREMDVEDMKGDKTPTSSEKEMRDGRRVVEV